MSQINLNCKRYWTTLPKIRSPNGKNSNEYRNLIATVTASPVLTERLNTAVEKRLFG